MTKAVTNLWTYIESLKLSGKDKQWLADRLVQSKHDAKTEAQAQYVRESLKRAMDEVREGKELCSAYDLLEDPEIW